MDERGRYEQELLLWKRRMIELREKYEGSPAGFLNSAQEKQEALSLWEEEKIRWKSDRKWKLLSYQTFQKQIFVGREQLLEKIKTALQSEKAPVFLYGIGGMGKTAAAQAYAAWQKDLYDHVLWLNCGEGIGRAVCDDTQILIEGLFYQQDRYGSRKRYLKEKCSALAQVAEGKKILLVLDDCNEISQKEAELVFRLPCHILVTSRLSEEELEKVWAGRKLPVGALENENQWKGFLQLYQTRPLTDEEENRLWKIKDRMEGHTLSVMLAIRKLEEGIEGEKMVISDSILSGYPIGQGEKKALFYLSAMPVRGVSEELFYQISGLDRKNMERLMRFMLVRRQFSEKEEKSLLSVHPMIAQAIVEHWHPSAFQCRRLFEGVKRYLWDAWDKTYEENEESVPIAFSMLRSFEPDARLAKAFGKLVALLWIQGYFQEAEYYSLKLYEEVERSYGEDHMMSGEMALWTAAVYHNQMAFHKAWEWYEKGAAILLSCQEESDQLLYLQSEALFKLARVNRYLERLEKSYKMIRQAENLAEKLLEKNRVKEPDISAEARLCYIRLEKAKICFAMGAYEKAEMIFQKARAEIMNIYPDGYRINEFLYFQILLLMRKEQYEKAEIAARQAYARAWEYRGADNKELLKCRENQGDISMELQNYDQAYSFYQEVLRRLSESYPFQENWKKQLEEKLRICDLIRRGQ